MPESIVSRTQPTPGDVFQCQIPVRWGDLDALAHVNNTVYFRYAEEARARLFEQAGNTLSSSAVPVLVHASFDFLKSLFYPSVVTVSLVFTRFGRTSLEFEVVVSAADNPAEVYARGNNVSVKTDRKTVRPVPWTDSDRAAYGQCFSPPADACDATTLSELS